MLTSSNHAASDRTSAAPAAGASPRGSEGARQRVGNATLSRREILTGPHALAVGAAGERRQAVGQRRRAGDRSLGRTDAAAQEQPGARDPGGPGGLHEHASSKRGTISASNAGMRSRARAPTAVGLTVGVGEHRERALLGQRPTLDQEHRRSSLASSCASASRRVRSRRPSARRGRIRARGGEQRLASSVRSVELAEQERDLPGQLIASGRDGEYPRGRARRWLHPPEPLEQGGQEGHARPGGRVCAAISSRVEEPPVPRTPHHA